MDHSREPPPAAAIERTPSAPRLSVAVLAVALLLLLFIPIVVRRRSDEIRRSATEIAEPARDQAEDLGRDLAAQVDAARTYALTHDPGSRLVVQAAGGDGDRALRQLLPLTAQLGPQAARSALQLQDSWRAWRAVTNELVAGRSPPAAAGSTDGLERAFRAVIFASARLDEEIGRVSALRRDQARRIDTVATAVTVALVLIVLGAMIALSLLSARLRTLAEVSRLRAIQEEALREQVQSAMEGRARLIRGFSHDVRNPLGAADGYGQLLETGIYGELTERQVESVRRLRRAIGAAVLLTDDLLDLARLEAGQLQTAAEPMDLLPVVRETAEDYRAQADTSRLELRVQLPEGVIGINSDERRIRQILSNLISNAIKYTPAGGRISVRLGTDRPGMAGCWVGVEVADTGPGIAPDQRARVFEEFSRLEPSTTHGVGLGLAIGRRLARALGGEITLEDAPGGGCIFTLWLPADRPAS